MGSRTGQMRPARGLLLVLVMGAGCSDWNEVVIIAHEPSPATDASGPSAPDGGPDAGPEPDAALPDASVSGGDLFISALGTVPFATRPGTTLTLELEVGTGPQGTVGASALTVTMVPQTSGAPREALSLSLPPLGANARDRQTVQLWVPPDLSPQRYCLEAEVDPLDQVRETDEDNNLKSAGCVWVSGLETAPDRLDFGTVGVGCTATATLTLSNRAQVAAQVFSAQIRSTSAVFAPLWPTGPIGITSGGRVELAVRYQPGAPGLHQGRLELEHSQVLGTVVVPLVAAASESPERVEHFTAWPLRRVDVLIVVDNSPTMQQEQARITQASSGLLNLLYSAEVDVHLGVTTTDLSPTQVGGIMQGGWLSFDTPDLGHELARSLRVGTLGSENEQGLQAGRLALRQDVNPGFRRAEAGLMLIFISDEDDHSPFTTSEYRDAFVLAAGPQGLTVVAVVGDAAAPCADTTAAGRRYSELALLTQGRSLNLCTFDWNSSLQGILPDQTGRQLDFGLSHAPTPGSVQVYVEDVPVPEVSAAGPRWRVQGRTLSFWPDAAPEPGAQVRVRYQTEC